MFQRQRSSSALLAQALPPRYRLASALIKRVDLDSAACDATRAAEILESVPDPLDDPTDFEVLDDAVERCADALAADAKHVHAMLRLSMALGHYGYLEAYKWHPASFKDARRFAERAFELQPNSPEVLDCLLRVYLYGTRYELASDTLNDLRVSGKHAWLCGFGRGLSFALNGKHASAAEQFKLAASAADATAHQRSEALVHLGLCLQETKDLVAADEAMAEGVLCDRPHRLKLHYWSKLKNARGRYDEAWELNRRSMTFGDFPEAQRWKLELLIYFRRIGFVPKEKFTLPEEQTRGVDGPFRYIGGEEVFTGDLADARDDEFVPGFRANLFLEGEHLPVVSEIADPGASFEGRAKLSVHSIDPRSLEKLPLLAGERFKPGQYIMEDERSGTVFHVLLLKRHNLHNPYLDLPEDSRSVFDLDRTAMQKFENAPWDVRLMLANHGFDPLRGVLDTCKLCDSFLRFAGGIGVDLETGLAVQGGHWRNEGFSNFDITKQVTIAARTHDNGADLTTRGLCKFKRPEIEVRDVSMDLVEGARKVLHDAARQAALGEFYRKGRVVGLKGATMVLRTSLTRDPEERPALELVDFARGSAGNNANSGLRALIQAEGSKDSNGV
ncbi:MAG: hypothetical protein ACYTDT_06090 [Planctomycetota bacterium]